MIDLERELSELRDEVRQLRRVADVQEIINLVMTYGPMVDAGDAEGTAQLWSSTGSYEVDGVLSMQGRDEIAKMVHTPLHQQLINGGAAHVLTVPRISIRDEEADGFNHALLIAHEAGKYRIERISANQWKFGKESGEWRILSRVNRPLDGRPAARELLGRVLS